jgi:hypothetical protein
LPVNPYSATSRSWIIEALNNNSARSHASITGAYGVIT